MSAPATASAPSAAAPDALDAPPSSHAPLSYTAFVALVALLMASNAIAIDVMLPALPAIGAALDVGLANDRQMVIAAYLVGFGFGQFFMGPITDRFGRRRVLLIGLALYGLGGLACGFAGAFDTILLARAVQGLGAAAPRVVVMALVRDCYRGRSMAQVMSFAMMVFMAAPVLAPTLGQGVMALAGWRSIFWLLGGYGIGLALLCFARLPETLPPERRRPLDPRALAESVRAVFASRQTVGYALAAGCFFGSLFGFIASAQQILGELYGLGPWFPVVFGCLALGIAISAFTNAMVVQRLGMRRMSHGACLAVALMGLALTVVGVAEGGRPPAPVFLSLLFLMMMGAGFVFSNVNALAMEPQGRQAGVASSLVGGTTTLIGASLGFWIGRVYDGGIVPLALGYAVCAGAAFLVMAFTERGRMFDTGPG